MAQTEIKISANADGFKKQVDSIEASIKKLEESLKGVAITSGAAFAGFVGVIGKSIAAYKEQEKAVNSLNQALKTQGIFSEQLSKQYQEQASELQNLTTFADDAIISAQAQIQAFLKDRTVSKELTQATLDLAQAKGIDLATAANIVGKSIGTSTNALQRYGVVVNSSATTSEKLDQVIKGLNRQFGGQAEAATQGLGALDQLKNTFGDIFDEIGKRLAPAVSTLAKQLNEFFKSVNSNEALLDLITDVLKAGAAISGTVLALATGGIAVLKFVQVLKIAQGVIAAFGGGIKAAIGATGIGLLLVVVADLAINFELRLKQMKAAFTSFTNFLSTIGGSVGDILKGIFTFDSSLIQKGLDGAKKAVVDSIAEYNEIRTEQDAKEVADEQKKQEAILEQQRAARQIQKDEYTVFLEEFQQSNTDFLALNQEQQNDFSNTALTTVQTQLQNEAAVRAQFAKQALDQNIANQNKYLADRVRFGSAYAAINAVINSEEIQGKKATIDSLVQLTNSGNQTLKTIGKAASVVQIGIKTAEGAISAYAALAGIPFVGPALGAAAAAALVAYGAEQTARVLAAQEGGIVPGSFGGGSFTDTVPSMLTPGELVVPRNSFDEVINAVADRRNQQAARDGDVFSEGGFNQGSVQVMIGFDGSEASQVLTARQNEDSALGLSRAFA